MHDRCVQQHQHGNGARLCHRKLHRNGSLRNLCTGLRTDSLEYFDHGLRLFGEDHWKLTPRLTFDLGLRYDYEALPSPYSTLVASLWNLHTLSGPSTDGLCGAYTGPGTCPTLAANANLANHPSNKLTLARALASRTIPSATARPRCASATAFTLAA